tara:strand:- start:184 stop:768 length:585 start_codon:yes stop_codon:yes gene_type:complete
MDLKFYHNAPESHPRQLEIEGEIFPLYYTIAPRYSHSWAYLMVDGMPIVIIDMLYGKIYQHSIERANLAVKNFRQNDKKWSIYYPNAFSFFDNVGIEESAPPHAFDVEHKELSPDIAEDLSFKLVQYSIDIYYEAETSEAFNTKQIGRKVRSQIERISVEKDDCAVFTVFDPELIEALWERRKAFKREKKQYCE